MVSGVKKVIVAMEHTTRQGEPRLVRECSYPLTARRAVDLIVTDLAVIEVSPEGLLLKEVAPTVTPNEVQALTEPKLRIAADLREAANIVKRHHRNPASRARGTDAATQGQRQASLVPHEDHPPGESTGRGSQRPAPEQRGNDQTTDELLRGILDQIKGMQRAEMFGEFSVTRMLAGVLQIAVVFCLLVTLWLLMRPNRDYNPILTTLGFAAVFQLMS